MRTYERRGLLACIGLSMAIGLLSPGVSRAVDFNGLTAAANHWMTRQVAYQKKVDKLDSQTQDLAQEYRETLRATDNLKLYNKQLKKQLRSQQKLMVSIRSDMRVIQTTAVQILPLMQNMLGSLKHFVSLDIPFLPQKRHNQIKSLEDLMARADVSLSEKFRAIVHAYQNEIDYGRTVGAYEGKLNNKNVRFLRIGRVALLYQTPDGSETGYWDNDAKKWVENDSIARKVSDGLKVASKRSAPALITVPVRTPQPVSTGTGE